MAWRHFVARPIDSLTRVLALGFAVYVVVYPFWVVTYPPMTDMPFHAAAMSILRNYWNPNWHFQEQFTLHLWSAPYVSFYVLGALLSLLFPVSVAAKIAAAVMLSLLPLGLGVLFAGMKKSPLWGLLGLGLVWSNLTHWGFLNFMGAVGLFAACVGFTLMVVDRPTPKRHVLLAVSLLAVFFTHIYRFPFAVLAVVATAVVMYPATKRLRVIVMPLLPSVIVFAAWRLFREAAFESTSVGPLSFDASRLDAAKIEEHLCHGFQYEAGEEEHRLFVQMGIVLLVLAVSATVAFFASGRARRRSPRERRWGIGVTTLPLLLAGGFVLAYFVLPMSMGNWWYVYPREITPALFIALGALPDMPRAPPIKLAFVVAIGLATARVGYFVAEQYDEFEDVTASFREIAPLVKPAPKLLYLVYEHTGGSRSHSPFVHLPAWVQAIKGGWLSFNFVSWQFSPIRYREGGVVPPPVPDRWEWEPEKFDVRKHGAWFDEFLVRDATDPGWRFRDDPSIELVSHRGAWWLYRRVQE